jgi:hypothetical protein
MLVLLLSNHMVNFLETILICTAEVMAMQIQGNKALGCLEHSNWHTLLP